MSNYLFKLSGVMEEVKDGQHLRFFTTPYCTKDVCLAACDYQIKNCHTLIGDILSVPFWHLDYVMTELEKKYKPDNWYLKETRRKYDERKKEGKLPVWYERDLKWFNTDDMDIAILKNMMMGDYIEQHKTERLIEKIHLISHLNIISDIQNLIKTFLVPFRIPQYLNIDFNDLQFCTINGNICYIPQ